MAHHLYGEAYWQWIDSCYDRGQEAINQLLAECAPALDGAGGHRAGGDLLATDLLGTAAVDPDGDPDARVGTARIAALDALAAACIEAILDDEARAPLGIAPHSSLRSHPDFPLRLGRSVIAALHLHGVLESSRWGSVLLGLMSRSSLLDGNTAQALELAVLALSAGSAGGGTHTRLAAGVLASSLSALGRPDLADPLHLELWASGIEMEAWKDPWEWEQAGPWTDGARFARNQDHGRPERLWRRELQGSRRSEANETLIPRMERFGLHRYHRICQIWGREIEVELLDLEDEAIQHEWEFL